MTLSLVTIQDTFILEEDAELASDCGFEEVVLVVSSPENSECVQF